MQQDKAAGIGRAGAQECNETQSMDKTKESFVFRCNCPAKLAELNLGHTPLQGAQLSPEAAPTAFTSPGPGPIQGGIFIFNILEAYHS